MVEIELNLWSKKLNLENPVCMSKQCAWLLR